MNFSKEPYVKLCEFVAQGFNTLLLKRDRLDRIFCITLIQDDRESIEIRNKMIDLEERVEIGRLAIEFNKDEKVGKHEIKIAADYFVGAKVFLLIYRWKDKEIISGIKLVTLDSKDHIIVAGGGPFTLVFQSSLYDEKFDPECDLSDYKSIEIE